MKKMFSLFLLFCLLLTACSAPATPSEVPTAHPQNTTAIPSSTSEPESLIETSPATGPAVNVQVDFSTYAPAQENNPKFTRLSPDPILNLQATNNGKFLYPFAGKIIHSNSYLGKTTDYRYGITDEDGCILADPVYTAVYPLLDEDTQTVMPIWILEKTEGELPEDEELYWYVYGTCYYGFAAMNGSFVSDCIYRSIYCNDGRIIALRHYEDMDAPTSFDVFDLKGKLLFTSSSLSFADKLQGGYEEYTYGEGLYSVAFDNNTDYPENANSSDYRMYERYLMNEEGKLVAGPYYDVLSLTGGPIAVMIESGNYVYIDKKGNVLSEAYPSCDPFRNGSAATVLPYDPNYPWVDRYYDILDTDMQILAHGENCFLPLPDGNYFSAGEVLSEDCSGEGPGKYLTTCYSPNGEILWTLDVECKALTTDVVLHFSVETPESSLENVNTGKTLPLPNGAECTIIGDTADPIICVEYEENSEEFLLFLSEDLEELGCIPGQSHDLISIGEVGSTCAKGFTLTADGCTILRSRGHEIYASYPIENYHLMQICPGKVAAFTDDFYTQLYTADGELFFSYPIATMDD